MAESLLLLSGRVHQVPPSLSDEEVHELVLDQAGNLRTRGAVLSRALAANPVRTEGQEYELSTDLSGNLRTKGLVLARAVNADPVRVNGQDYELTTDLDGRLRVSAQAESFSNVTGALTTAGSAAANVLAVSVIDASNVTFTLKNTGSVTMNTGVFNFEASLDSTDGVDGNWVAVQAVRSNGNSIESATVVSGLAAGAVQTYAWETSVNAFRMFRIRCFNSVTASSIASWTIARGSYATEPIPAVATHPVTGSGTFTVSGTVVTNPVTGNMYANLGAGNTTGLVIKASGGNIYDLSLVNPTAATIWVKFYNKATVPVVTTDSNLMITSVEVPPGKAVHTDFGPLGKRFSSGISFATTANVAITDNTAPGAGLLLNATYQ